MGMRTKEKKVSKRLRRDAIVGITICAGPITGCANVDLKEDPDSIASALSSRPKVTLGPR